MSFHSVSEFFAMGGFAAYVWTCVGLVLAVMLLNVVVPIRQRKQLIASFQRQHAAQVAHDAVERASIEVKTASQYEVEHAS